MELAINRRGAKWIEDLKARLVETVEDDAEVVDEMEDEAPVCEHFAYKRTLLFYSEECRCCRYAQRVTDASGEKTYVCTCALNAKNGLVG